MVCHDSDTTVFIYYPNEKKNGEKPRNIKRGVHGPEYRIESISPRDLIVVITSHVYAPQSSSSFILESNLARQIDRKTGKLISVVLTA